MYWFLLIGLALAGLGGLMLAYNLRTLERRALLIESTITEARKDSQTARDAAATALDESRRAHVRLDNHQRSISAIAADIGWSDDRAHTKVLTAPIPAMAKKPPR